MLFYCGNLLNFLNYMNLPNLLELFKLFEFAWIYLNCMNLLEFLQTWISANIDALYVTFNVGLAHSLGISTPVFGYMYSSHINTNVVTVTHSTRIPNSQQWETYGKGMDAYRTRTRTFYCHSTSKQIYFRKKKEPKIDNNWFHL